MTGPVELPSSLEDLEALHRLVTPDRGQLPPHSAKVPGQLLARIVADLGAMYRRLGILGLTEPR